MQPINVFVLIGAGLFGIGGTAILTIGPNQFPDYKSWFFIAGTLALAIGALMLIGTLFHILRKGQSERTEAAIINVRKVGKFRSKGGRFESDRPLAHGDEWDNVEIEDTDYRPIRRRAPILSVTRRLARWK